MSALGQLRAAAAARGGLTTAVVAAFALLVALGSWQMQRRAWKAELLAQIAARAHAEPMSTEAVLLLKPTKDELEYRRVRLTGRFLHDKEMHLRTIENGKPGWNVITPFETNKGFVLVNRGFVPLAMKDSSKRAAGLVPGEASVTGLVRVPAAERGAFLPENRPVANEWYWIDLPAMQKEADVAGNFLPFVVAAERVAGVVPPLGGATLLELPNRHLEYALTWYALAATLLVVYATYMVNQLK